MRDVTREDRVMPEAQRRSSAAQTPGLMKALADEIEKLPSGTPDHVRRLMAEQRAKRAQAAPGYLGDDADYYRPEKADAEPTPRGEMPDGEVETLCGSCDDARATVGLRFIDAPDGTIDPFCTLCAGEALRSGSWEKADEDDAEKPMTEERVAALLSQLLGTGALQGSDADDADEVAGLSSFEEAGLMTSDKGLVIEMHDGSEFQLTIKQSAR